MQRRVGGTAYERICYIVSLNTFIYLRCGARTFSFHRAIDRNTLFSSEMKYRLTSIDVGPLSAHIQAPSGSRPPACLIRLSSLLLYAEYPCSTPFAVRADFWVEGVQRFGVDWIHAAMWSPSCGLAEKLPERRIATHALTGYSLSQKNVADYILPRR